METTAKVRRDHFVHGKSIKQISRERGISARLRSADAILNILARRGAPEPAETVTPPAHLRLRGKCSPYWLQVV
mgnify:CR=1 FL=1